ncbi:MAG: hypothetical protein QOK16_4636 [Solirubrobacteraceae bacterium]|jgi:hypothetical protein|nr:hypothetical protein [Solirubrobacteraceae bacterium]
MMVCFDGLPVSEEALRTANTLVQPVGTASVDLRLIEPLAYVPLNNLIAFKKRGGQILFAKSYLSAVDSDDANVRRGYPLTEAQRRMYAEFDEPKPPVYGLYDPELDALVFSTALEPINQEHLVLHEFGHAMTFHAWQLIAHQRADLLFGLPPQIADLLELYPAGGELQAISTRVLEVLAEAYVWTVVGRFSELPGRLGRIVQDVLAGQNLRPTG